MSRIGKRIITIPEGVTVDIKDTTVTVKGKEGQLERTFNNIVTVSQDQEGIKVNPVNESVFARAMWGTASSHISNMIDGVTNKFKKELVIEGVGLRAEVKGNILSMQLGFSHGVEMQIPEGLEVVVEKNTVSITGIDKEKVGLFASKVRLKKKPEPYKGKGIRYKDEVIIRKEGKKGA